MKQRVLLLFFFIAGIAAAVASDSPIPSQSAESAVTKEQIETAIQAIEARDGLDEESRSAIVDQLREAQLQIDQRQAAEASAALFEASIDSAPAQTQRLRTSLEQPADQSPTAESLGLADDVALGDLEPLLARESANRAAADSRLAALESQIATESERPSAIGERIGELRGILEQLATELGAEPPPGEPPLLGDARLLNTALKRNARAAELNQLEQELRSQGVRLQLLRAERDVAAREALTLRRKVEFLQGIVNRKRQLALAEAQADALRAELAAADKHPAVRALAEENATLLLELPEVAADIERATQDLASIQRHAQQIEQNFARSRQRLDIGGVNQAIGQILLEERRGLPRFSQYRGEAQARQKTISNIGLAQLRIEEQRSELAAFDVRVEETMGDVSADIADEQELESVRNEVVQLLRDRRDLLNKAASTYSSYLRTLGDLDIAQTSLVESAAEYREFLDKNLLWIPSTTVVGVNTVTNFAESFNYVLSPTRWIESIRALVRSTRDNVAVTVAALLLLAAALVSRRLLVAQIRSINSRVGRLSTDHIGLTLAALLVSAVIALPIPLALAIPGWALQRVPTPTDFTISLSLALLAVAPFLYNLMLFRTVCAKNGVARVHFGLQEKNLRITRRQLDRLIVIGAPIVFVAVLAYQSPVASHGAGLGRLAFIAFMIVFALAMRSLGDPRKSIAKTYYDKRPESWVSRLKWLWFSIETIGPVSLAVLASAGYLYTAVTLTGKFIQTIWLVLGLILVNLIVLRWLALTRRKIAWQMALDKRAARKAEEHAEVEQEADSEIPVVEPKQLNLDAVDQQTRRLLRAGLLVIGILFGWAIWSDLLPAFRVFEDVSLWSQTVTVDGVATAAPVTLADLLLALIIAGATAVASRNLPGLMEIAVLQRLDLDPGSRYTINTLLRYAVVTIGVVSVFSIIGWNWSQIQWLVAALSVGLGFGLQEIVANFVSGLIILFERPVRVGDTVTVGELTGTVTKVRIRATTITDWDRKEIIVPNKNFITEQVVNWTLTDPITRVVVPVGISYGSDVALATRVMEDTLHKMPLVLDEPAPHVYFMGFGDSSLNFKLYVYSRQLSDRLPLMHAVHKEIWAALRQNGIEIPFPQRDLHIKSGKHE